VSDERSSVAYCTNCGTEFQANQRFCSVCGAPTSGVTAMPPLSVNEVIPEARVLVGLSMDPPLQSRWSVLLRSVLTIPLFIVAVVIAVAAGFVTFISWFAALFTGRVPDSFQEFLTGALRLYANVLSYAYFLTPRWPGIAFSAKPSNQVTLEIDHVKLRRAAVFFRVILVYPANLVSGLLFLGVLPFVAVMWLWGIVAGREPRSLHQAVALVLRYQIRLQAYSTLLTPTQPFRGLFGDGVDSVASAPVVPAAPPPTSPLSFGAPSLTTDVTSSPAGDDSRSPALPTRWIVSKAARAFVVVALVLGVPVYIGVAQAERPFITKVQDVFARTVATASYSTTINAMNNFQSSVQNCAASTYVGCAARAATTASAQLNSAAAGIQNTTLFPSSARGLANIFQANLDELESEVTAVQFSTSATTSMNVVESEIPQTEQLFINSYKRLKSALSN
jgi:hypothetical protein